MWQLSVPWSMQNELAVDKLAKVANLGYTP